MGWRMLILPVLLLHAVLVSPPEAPWTWAGIEIFGNHTVPRAEIEDRIPIPIGESYQSGDTPFWKDACADVEKRFGFVKVVCGDRPLMVFPGRKVYLIVDIVEKGHERLLEFRAAPTGTVRFANDEMVTLSAELEKKTMAVAMAGHAYNESAEKGYLTYTDPGGQNEDMGPLVERLAQIVPQHRANLFDVLRNERDRMNRRAAATLLNWWGGDPDQMLEDTIPLLDDPDAGVRNNLSRFMTKFVGKVRSKRLRHRLIDTFLLQIQRPSHGDRNKGVYDLLFMAQASPADCKYIRRRGTEPIRYLADNSIVFNVRDPAKELLALVEPAKR